MPYKKAEDRRRWETARWHRDPEKQRAAKRRAYQKNKEKYRLNQRAWTYGLTVQQLLEFLDKAENRCEICGMACPKLCVDHDHNSNTVRGILCVNCNTGIGMFNENTANMEKAIEYLKAHKTAA